MVEIEIVEPNISQEENQKNLEIVKGVLEEIARDMQRKRRVKTNE
ncbi:hypothetical protein CLPUN_08020 [Clostridium puniceum]|uniref:Uncharacterized protein n=1 Tax=Clostridium puniceum TaxID=29367 RepID=A0A1S8TVS5_9CLOT|nr:hypothetical protein [Clostridium puniceum]OOM81840.1 hypothetical protein CLPUN_08020 [Clostridium puniceum]